MHEVHCTYHVLRVSHTAGVATKLTVPCREKISTTAKSLSSKLPPEAMAESCARRLSAWHKPFRLKLKSIQKHPFKSRLEHVSKLKPLNDLKNAKASQAQRVHNDRWRIYGHGPHLSGARSGCAPAPPRSGSGRGDTSQSWSGSSKRCRGLAEKPCSPAIF